MKLLVKPVELSKLDSHLKTDCLVIPIFDDKKQPTQTEILLKQLGFPLDKRLKDGSISAKLGSCSQVYINSHGVTLLSLGMGQAKELTSASYRKAISQGTNSTKSAKFSKISWLVDGIVINDWPIELQATALSQQLTTSSYQFTRCKSKADKPTAAEHTLLVNKASVSAVKKAVKVGSAVGKGMNLARELGDLPGNICTPNYLAKQARELAKGHSELTVKVLSEKQMASLGMHSLLSVSAGSIEPAQLIVMEYNGGAKSSKPHVLVGKGITFDTGGISLKPGGSMDEMKYDMCGAASVFGAMQTLLEVKPNINVVCVVAAAENMPSDRATKPGDIVTSMSGQTIEVLNTDAEGRLVLCDALTYVERYKPKSVIDVATLTGACVVALGKHASAVYSNQDDFAHTLLKAGQIAGDRAWHMPLWDDYQKQLDSNFADMANIGGRDGGSITAACFLSRFAKAYRWAHLDIAGTAWLSGGAKGATGRPVPLLVEYLLNHSS